MSLRLACNPLEIVYRGIALFEGWMTGWIEDQVGSNVETARKNVGGSVFSFSTMYSGGAESSNMVEEAKCTC